MAFAGAWHRLLGSPQNDNSCLAATPLDEAVDGHNGLETAIIDEVNDQDLAVDFQPSSDSGFRQHAISNNAEEGRHDKGIQHVETLPIDVPSIGTHASSDGVQKNTSSHVLETSRDSLPFSLPRRTRESSTSFDSNVVLKMSEQKPLDRPLREPSFRRRRDGRRRTSLLDAMADDRTKSAGRGSSLENNSPFTEQESGDRGRSRLRTEPIHKEHPCYSILNTSVHKMASEGHILQPPSLTSQSTVSPRDNEAITPIEENTTFMLSSLQVGSQGNGPWSFEESTKWGLPNRKFSQPRAQSYTFGRNRSMRQGFRPGSRRSAVSNLSAASPASAFLSMWGPNSDPPPVEPDDVGREVGDYVLGKKIGFGGFSVVHEASKFDDNGHEAWRGAVKIVRKQIANKSDQENEQFQNRFEHEIYVWDCLKNPNILPLTDRYQTKDATYCFMPLTAGGSLADVLRNNRKGLPRDLIQRYAYQLASAIRYLHNDVRVVHRDIKLENCLIDLSDPHEALKGGRILLCDFGMADFYTNENGSTSFDETLATNARSTETRIEIAGSLEYSSPEVLNGPHGLLLSAADIWAFGVVLYALVTGNLPFRHSLPSKLAQMIVNGNWDRDSILIASKLKGSAHTALELVEACLDMKAESRWSISQILDSEFLQTCRDADQKDDNSWTYHRTR
ncbi:MAG: hypothetical protein M1834_001036 [Cirrosporium novae-zelandiae]|nr:MAG: hypothetical protein M1834_001036 [Cirrosporium novae-zelandiae]